MYTILDLYDLDHTIAADYLRQFTYPWEALKGIKDLILDALNNGNRNCLNSFKFFLGFLIYGTGSINDGILCNTVSIFRYNTLSILIPAGKYEYP